jgi:hypothetical protein
MVSLYFLFYIFINCYYCFKRIIKGEDELQEVTTEEDDNEIQNEINENLEQLKRVEELLNKAQKINNPSSQKNETKIKQNEERVVPTPPVPSKPSSKLPTKLTKKPVYMNAPFKTEPNLNTFKSKPKTLVKSSSQKSIDSIDSKPQLIEQPKEKISAAKTTKEQETVKSIKETKTNQIEFSLKKDGKELRLPPSTEDSVVKNFRFKQNLSKNRKNETKSRESFREKLEKCCFKQSSPAFLHYLINKLSVIYDKLKDFIKLINSELLEIDENSKDDLNKLKLAQLHSFGEKLKILDVKLGMQVDAINLQIKKNYTFSSSSINIFETKAFKTSNSITYEEEDEEANFSNPISYKNENELKKYFDFKINIIELEFKSLFINFLDDIFLNSDLKENETNYIEKFNLLFGLITDKRSFIVKQ